MLYRLVLGVSKLRSRLKICWLAKAKLSKRNSNNRDKRKMSRRQENSLLAQEFTVTDNLLLWNLEMYSITYTRRPKHSRRNWIKLEKIVTKKKIWMSVPSSPIWIRLLKLTIKWTVSFRNPKLWSLRLSKWRIWECSKLTQLSTCKVDYYKPNPLI